MRRGLPGLVLLGVVLLLWCRRPPGTTRTGSGSASSATRACSSDAERAGIVFAGHVRRGLRPSCTSISLRAADLRRPQIVLGTGADGRPISLEGRQLAGWRCRSRRSSALVFALSARRQLAEVAELLQRRAVRRRRPAFRPRRRVLRLPSAGLAERFASRRSSRRSSPSSAARCYYVLSGSFVIEPRYGVAFWPRIRLVPAARRHLSLLGARRLRLLAWGAWLDDSADAARRRRRSSSAPSYADVHADCRSCGSTSSCSSLGAALVDRHGSAAAAGRFRSPSALYLVVSMAGGIYAGIVQRFFVTPNEPDKEQPFIQHNIAATRAAYALDRVDERELSGDAELTPQDIVANAGTIENVRLWDHQPLLETFAQIQEIRTYYDFVSVDNDRYMIDGKYRQVMLSARELNTESLPNRTWVNERLTFTHGYGLTLGPVNQVTTEGLPVLFIRDMPPVSTVESAGRRAEHLLRRAVERLRLREARRQPEFHYPRGDDNVTTTTPARAACRSAASGGGCCSRCGSATTDILVTNQITAESRVLFHRHIGERVQTLAPFLTFDADPYLVVSDGRLFWIQDAYTTTDSYPYSTPTARDAGDDQLHPQLGEDRHRRLQRHDDVLSGRPERSDGATLGSDVPRPAAAAVARCRRTCGSTCAIRRTSSPCRRRCSRRTT